MNRTSKVFSVSLSVAVAEALEREAAGGMMTPGLKIAEIVEDHFLAAGNDALPADAKAELALLRGLRDDAIDKMAALRDGNDFPADITLQTFQACQADPDWLSRYAQYVQGHPLVPGNPRKTNANQTIGSRIKSVLGARDLTDADGKALRGRAPVGTIIQTYQLLAKGA